jgi:hypothetical protein
MRAQQRAETVFEQPQRKKMARGLKNSQLVKEEETQQRNPAAGEANRRYYLLNLSP